MGSTRPSEARLVVTVQAMSEVGALRLAAERGARWYGVPATCVAGTVRSVRDQGDLTLSGEDTGGFIAEVEVYVSHRIERPTYGPPECLRCHEKFWPR